MREVNRRAMLAGLGCSCGLGFVPGCQSVPMSGRRRVALMTPESQEIQLGLQAYKDTLAGEQLSQNPRSAEIVRKVGQRIAAVANRDDYQWEFNLIASESQNAFALPGGKVAVFEGILSVCQNEAGLAVVMAHEVAHALARHGGERMQQETAVNAGKQIASAVTRAKFPEKATLMAHYYGAATKYGILLPFSRKHESEADHIGIMLMAKAGYDPQAAPEFWTRFGELKSEQTPEWLSTHPADSRRAADLQSLLPAASAEYSEASQKLGMGAPVV